MPREETQRSCVDDNDIGTGYVEGTSLTFEANRPVSYFPPKHLAFILKLDLTNSERSSTLRIFPLDGAGRQRSKASDGRYSAGRDPHSLSQFNALLDTVR